MGARDGLHFGPDWLERATLDDGSEVLLRPIRPDDKTLLLQGFQRLSPGSRYLRFLGSKSTLSEAELRYLTEVDGRDHFAIVAIGRDERGEPEGLGVARFVRLRDRPDAAEAAITVVDRAQGRGLGRLLFLRLAAAAWERGVRRFQGEVLESNTRMRALLNELAPEAHPAGEGVLSFDAPLPELPPDLPAHEKPAGNPLYRLLRLFAEGAAILRPKREPGS